MIIARAKAEQRTIVTADLDYPRLLALAGANEPSLILFRGGNWSDADIIARMRQLLETFGDGGIEHSILVVDRDPRAAKAVADPAVDAFNVMHAAATIIQKHSALPIHGYNHDVQDASSAAPRCRKAFHKRGNVP